MAGRQRLVVEDVETGAGDPVLAERPQQRGLVDDGGAGGEVLAPGRHVHAEGLADPGDPATDLAQAEQPERTAVQIGAEGALPGAAAAHGGALGDDAAGEAEDQRPGQFDGRLGVAGRTADGDTVPRGGFQVDGGIAHSGGDQEP